MMGLVDSKMKTEVKESLNDLPNDYEEMNMVFKNARLSSDPSNYASVRTCQMFNETNLGSLDDFKQRNLYFEKAEKLEGILKKKKI